jgi:uncharacterized alpha-E superfamily protein
MLSRTADNLFWIARYIERAETAARLLDVGARIALLPNEGQGHLTEWDSLLRATGTADAFARKYGEPVQRNLESHLFFDRDNPASVASCITRARENGRIVRTALTAQVWDALNTAFAELRALERMPRSELGQDRLSDWTMRQAAIVRGAIDGTLLRNDGYDFLQIGYNLERADNTARLLDVKYFVLLPKADFVGTGLDNYQWMTLLRALSSPRAFHWAYGGEVTAAKIAHFFLLNPQCPRALVTCLQEVELHLSRLAHTYGRDPAALAQAREMRARLEALRIEEVFDIGLHDVLSDFIAQIAQLGGAVHAAYLSGDTR